MDYLTISAFLCPEGTKWKYEHDPPCSFPRAHMSWMGKVWLYLMSGYLLPSIHVSNVTRDRAYMVYTILIGSLFDVWIHISSEIEQFSMASREGLWLPSIISKLC